MEAVECGAASLAMLLAYYGKIVPLTELRLTCGVSRDGSKASNIVKAARHYGMTASGARLPVEALYNEKLPCILYWDFCHFVVLEGFHHRKRFVYLNDPSEGHRKVTFEEFDRLFTGIALSIAPGPEFQRGGKSVSVLGGLQSRLAGSWVAIGYVAIISVLMAAVGIVVPAYSKVFVDECLVGENQDYLRPLLWIMGATAAIQWALVWLQQYYLLRLETKLAVAGASKTFWHLLRLPLSYYSQRYAGDVGSRVFMADRLAQLLSRDLASAALSLINIVFFAAIMFLYDVTLTLMGIGFSALSMGLVFLVARVRITATRKMQHDSGRAMGIAMGGVQIMESLKASGSEADFFARWSGEQVKVSNARQSLGTAVSLLGSLSPFLAALANVAILGFGSLRVMQGDMSMGMLIAFQALMIGLSGPINQLVQLSGKIQDASGDICQLDDALKNPVDPRLENLNGQTLPTREKWTLEGIVELRDISFGYSALEPPLIKNFSLTLTSGSRVALVGGSGSGKSTIAKILSGVVAPWEGEVLIDGKRRDDYPRELLSQAISMVDQDICVFSGTVHENLAMWDQTVDESQLVQSAKDAQIHDVIASRQNGYDCVIEERGCNFSGGQLQRLEIARALVSNPSVLILDEATSALDPTTEKLVGDNLRRRGCTCLIVAHRLSTIRDCEEIIVLEKGTVVERGTHEELLANKANYFQLIKAA
jgi:NHLM bacteriocin system ABC transporter peptidase/ATP-binding protein